jgi:hypothetical protein
MSDLDDINDAIVTNASGPKHVSSDDRSIDQHPLADQIAVANHLAGQTAATKPRFGLRITKLISPGAW